MMTTTTDVVAERSRQQEYASERAKIKTPSFFPAKVPKRRCVRFEPATRGDVNEVVLLATRRSEERKMEKTSFCGLPMSARGRSSKKVGAFLYKSDKKTANGLVAATMRSNGFKRTGTEKWSIYWASHAVRAHEYKKMRAFQRCNQFPKTQAITRKDALSRSVVKMQQLFGERRFRFLPRTFVLPAETVAYREFAKKTDMSWIVKPANQACGRGIFVTSDPREVVDVDMGGDPYVVSEYVDRPMLIEGLKFDMRIYVAVTSFYPLTVYVFRDGLARFATEKYEADDDESGAASRFKHLTNYSVNKHSATFVENDDVASDKGTKQSLQAVMRKLRAEGVDVSAIWARTHDLIVKTLISIQRPVNAAMRSNMPHGQSCCFQLFGFDVLLDADLKPWLVEVNFSPSLNTDAAIDLHIKGRMLSDLFNLAGVRAGNRSGSNSNSGGSRRAVRRSPLDRIAAADSRSGGFYRIFPNRNAFLYLDLFEEEKGSDERSPNRIVADLLFDAGSGSEDDEGKRRVLQERMKREEKRKGLDADGGCMGLACNEVWGARVGPDA